MMLDDGRLEAAYPNGLKGDGIGYRRVKASSLIDGISPSEV
jgi:hypothetical protein